jgi:signal transduction histidine kinase/CheY-like chemotaxis protein/methylphosphotriester-DNA--protein-cysteine methyltransferase
MLLTITPPWWTTSWAYIFYLLFFASILYGSYYYQRRRWALQTALQLQEQESGRLKELDAFRTNLFTNITHEFRTPLTVISGMTDLIRKEPKVWLQRGIMAIEQQSRKLLTMVNQMLDLQKLEAGKMELDLSQADIISFINYRTEPFFFMANAKNLALLVEHSSHSLLMDFDSEKMAQIVNNLVSNAIKYTDKGIVALATKVVDRITFEISVKDTGVGIRQDNLAHIFDRFYQADTGSTRRGEGTGIGLALVNELVDIMQGSIEVKSDPGKGSEFIIRLPISNNATISTKSIDTGSAPPIPLSLESVENKVEGGKIGARILIIEDNLDVRRYLTALLQVQFQIEEATDGIQGIEKSLEMIPDLIICDVMMPGKDGYEVCNALHQHPLTNHIPIILLTAKADSKSKVQGYEQGADAYLTKPFLPEELQAQITMLLQQRERLQTIFQQQLRGDPVQIDFKRQDSFLMELEGIVLNNLEDDTYDISRLCSIMHVSRSQMHCKIKSLTGYSTSLFIRKIRLREARKMLLETEKTISEIAYNVGFKDPNFFSRVYKKEFGNSPTEGRGLGLSNDESL